MRVVQLRFGRATLAGESLSAVCCPSRLGIGCNWGTCGNKAPPAGASDRSENRRSPPPGDRRAVMIAPITPRISAAYMSRRENLMIDYPSFMFGDAKCDTA